MNNISIVGRITKDVELQTTANGTDYTRFNVAVPNEFKNDNGEREADFFICVAWRTNAENISKYFKKGSPIGLVGSMNSRVYQAKDGTKQTIWELNVKNFSFVGTNDPIEQKKSDITPVDSDDDDLPF